MRNSEEFVAMALSFHHTEQAPHFDRIAIKVTKKRIFATYHARTKTANIKLKPAEQATFCDFPGGAIFPVPNAWGKQGWTTFLLEKLPEELLKEALLSAYSDVVRPAEKK